MDNGERQQPEVISTPRDWARKEMERIVSKAKSASLKNNDPELYHDIFDKCILESSHYLLFTFLSDPEAKQTLARQQMNALKKPPKPGTRPIPVGQLDPLECMEEIGEILIQEKNPLGIHLLLAATLDTLTVQDTVDRIPEQPGLLALRQKTTDLITNGGKIIFPSIVPVGTPIEAHIDFRSEDIVTYKSNPRNAVTVNNSILTARNTYERALNMIQPKKL